MCVIVVHKLITAYNNIMGAGRVPSSPPSSPPGRVPTREHNALARNSDGDGDGRGMNKKLGWFINTTEDPVIVAPEFPIKYLC